MNCSWAAMRLMEKEWRRSGVIVLTSLKFAGPSFQLMGEWDMTVTQILGVTKATSNNLTMWMERTRGLCNPHVFFCSCPSLLLNLFLFRRCLPNLLDSLWLLLVWASSWVLWLLKGTGEQLSGSPMFRVIIPGHNNPLQKSRTRSLFHSTFSRSNPEWILYWKEGFRDNEVSAMVDLSDNIPYRITTLYQAFYEIMDNTVRMQSWNLRFVEVTRYIKTKFQPPSIKTQTSVFFFKSNSHVGAFTYDW